MKEQPPKRLPPILGAELTGLEPATSCVTGRRSNQLSYSSKYYLRSRGGTRTHYLQLMSLSL